MKLKNRRDDASTPETDEWAKMNDWFAELRDDRSPGLPVMAWLSPPAMASLTMPSPNRLVMAPPIQPLRAWLSPPVIAAPSRPAMAAASREPPPRRLPTSPHRAPGSVPAPRSRSGRLSATSCGCRPHGARWAPASGATPIPRRSARPTPVPARSRPAGASMPSAGWPAPDASRPAPPSGPPARLPCGTGIPPSPRPP